MVLEFSSCFNLMLTISDSRNVIIYFVGYVIVNDSISRIVVSKLNEKFNTSFRFSKDFTKLYVALPSPFYFALYWIFIFCTIPRGALHNIITGCTCWNLWELETFKCPTLLSLFIFASYINASYANLVDSYRDFIWPRVIGCTCLPNTTSLRLFNFNQS